MAAIIACKDYLLLSNGTDAGILHFSSPREFQQLPVPNFPSLSRGDPAQACLPARRKGAPDPKGDGDTARGDQVGDSKGKSTDNNNGEEHAQPNYTRAMSISHTGSHVAVCDDRKYLHVFQVGGDGLCSLISSRCTARRCTDVCFSPDDSLVLVADKSGDAYSFPTLGQGRRRGQGHDQGENSKSLGEGKIGPNETAATNQNENKEEEEDADEGGEEEGDGDGDGTLVLGHLSMLLGVMLLDGGRKVVTCDRDEKIRVSSFPDAYNIHAYCLGHTEFVIGLAYCHVTKLLLSASGDCTVRAWTLDGTQVCVKNVLEDLPQDHPLRAAKPALQDDNSDDSRPHQPADNTYRPSIRHMSYCQQCSLLFVSLERSPSVLVYRLQVQPAASPDSPISEGSLCHVTNLGESSGNTVSGPAADPTREASGPGDNTDGLGSVAGLWVSECTLWLLRQHGDQLSLAAFTICQGQDNEVKICPVSADSTESQAVKTVAEQTDFLTAQSAADDLLPFLWKSNFQDDFKLQCNLKRGSKVEEGAAQDSKSGRGKKKAKIGEKGR